MNTPSLRGLILIVLHDAYPHARVIEHMLFNLHYPLAIHVLEKEIAYLQELHLVRVHRDVAGGLMPAIAVITPDGIDVVDGTVSHPGVTIPRIARPASGWYFHGKPDLRCNVVVNKAGKVDVQTECGRETPSSTAPRLVRLDRQLLLRHGGRAFHVVDRAYAHYGHNFIFQPGTDGAEPRCWDLDGREVALIEVQFEARAPVEGGRVE